MLSFCQTFKILWWLAREPAVNTLISLHFVQSRRPTQVCVCSPVFPQYLFISNRRTNLFWSITMITYDLLRPTILYDVISPNKFVVFKHPLVEEHSFLERQVWHASVTARMLQPKHPVRGNRHSRGCHFNVTSSNCARAGIHHLSREFWNMSLSLGKQQKCTQIRSKKTHGVKRFSQVLKTKF